jgi:glycosyltransferase involved in cell wall biosynthesis
MIQQPHIFWFAFNEGEARSAQCRSQFVLHHIQAKHGFTFDLVQASWRLDQLMYFLFVFVKIVFSSANHPLVIQGAGARGFFSFLVRQLVKFRPRNTYYDIDEAEWLKDSAPHTHFFLRRVSTVLAGNAALAAYAKKYNQQVVLLPTVSPEIVFEASGKHQRFSIGWVRNDGADTLQQEVSFQGLHELIYPAVVALSRPVRLVLIGINSTKERRETRAFFAPYPHVELVMPTAEEVDSPASLARLMSSVHVAVCPSLDNEYEGFQSAFFAKQFLKLGVPVLASRLAEFLFLIQHGENGFLCDCSADFADYLYQLAAKNEVEMEVVRLHCMASYSPDQERLAGLAYAKLFFSGYNSALLKGNVPA